MREIKITSLNEGGRLDKILFKYLDKAGSGFIYKMLRKKNIVLNDKKVQGNEILKAGDVIKLYLSEETIEKFRSAKESSSSSLTVPEGFLLYEDSRILAVNKPVGMLSQRSEDGDVSANDLILNYLGKTDTFTPGIANRLDRNTGGIILAGKDLKSARLLSSAIKERALSKYYYALCSGEIRKPDTICAYLTKDKKTNQVKITEKPENKDSQAIKTAYRSLASNGTYTLLEVDLITGRSHQIRAHMAYMGHALAGDTKYGKREVNSELREKYGLKSQFLFAGAVEFTNMTDELEYLNGKRIEAPFSAYLKKILKGENIWLPGLQED